MTHPHSMHPHFLVVLTNLILYFSKPVPKTAWSSIQTLHNSKTAIAEPSNLSIANTTPPKSLEAEKDDNTDTQTDRQTDRQSDRQSDSQTVRQSDSQTDSQTVRQ